MAVPQSKPLRSIKIPGASDRDRSPESSSSSSAHISENPDERAILSSLKELVAAGNHALDPILQTITDIARQLTGASGAALAMWKDGAMVCRARSGDIAPVLGAQLSAKTGISGECLRTGKIQHCADTENDPLVDRDVCHSLGLRSIAALPIRSWRGVNGILEVFSTSPAAFREQHIALLQKLALLAERARTSQSESASSAAPHLPSELPASGLPAEIEAAQRSSPVLPASDRVGNVERSPRGARAWPFVLGAIGLMMISLLTVAIWRGWRGQERTDRKTQATPSSTGTPIVSSPVAGAGSAGPATLDVEIGPGAANDKVSKANPAGTSISLSPLSPSQSPSDERPSAGSTVKLASKVDAVAGTKTQADRTQVDRSLSTGVIAPNVVVRYGLPGSQSGSNNGSKTGSKTESKIESHPDSRSNLQSDAATSVEPLSIPAGSATSSALNGVFSAKVSLPRLSIPVSQGVSGGQLVHQVPPVYPAQARVLRLEGKVVLAAVIVEDGTLRDVKVIEGPPLLAESAVEAVKHWRYKPYQLDGKPVKNEIRINIDFKFPDPSH